jgi:23S rRNA (cytosine1962-C5)-methyltransferase
VADPPDSNVRRDEFAEARVCLREAQARRAPHLDRVVQGAWRVLNGAGDGGPSGLTVDRYGSYLVVSAREQLAPELVSIWCKAAAEELAPTGIVLKTLRVPVSAGTSELVFGSPPPTPLAIREEDAVLLCDLLAEGLSTGLFLDQHDLRRRARTFAAGVEVLNLFAHTCAFSVHAALGGATRVTSIDSSKKALRRGRENMEASGLDPNRHRWFPDDVHTHLERAVRRGDRYGLVILDPPVLGRARNKTRTLAEELDRLIAQGLAVTADGGTLLLSVHALEVSVRALRAVVANEARALGRRAVVREELGLPAWDHPTRAEGDAEGDRGHYLKTLIVGLG